ncbi:cytochrome P460 family protein [Nitrosococcus halophilus]|nr:cytochrome P460 family protein [Nitrosococcus halophilus]
MKKKLQVMFSFMFLGVIGGIAYAGYAGGGGGDNKVAYPEGYRDWYHVKSMVIMPGHPLEDPFQGIHHIYANDKGLEGLKTGNYTKGAVLVFDLLDYEKGGNALQEGERKLIGVMEWDKERFSSTGNWGFEGFAGNSKTERLTKDGGQSCYECHTAQKDNNYVFTQLRD